MTELSLFFSDWEKCNGPTLVSNIDRMGSVADNLILLIKKEETEQKLFLYETEKNYRIFLYNCCNKDTTLLKYNFSLENKCGVHEIDPFGYPSLLLSVSVTQEGNLNTLSFWLVFTRMSVMVSQGWQRPIFCFSRRRDFRELNFTPAKTENETIPHSFICGTYNKSCLFPLIESECTLVFLDHNWRKYATESIITSEMKYVKLLTTTVHLDFEQGEIFNVDKEHVMEFSLLPKCFKVIPKFSQKDQQLIKGIKSVDIQNRSCNIASFYNFQPPSNVNVPKGWYLDKNVFNVTIEISVCFDLYFHSNDQDPLSIPLIELVNTRTPLHCYPLYSFLHLMINSNDTFRRNGGEKETDLSLANTRETIVTSPFLYYSSANKTVIFGPFPKGNNILNTKTISCREENVLQPRKKIRLPPPLSKPIDSIMCVAVALVNEKAVTSHNSDVLFMLPKYSNSMIGDDLTINVSLPFNHSKRIYSRKTVKILNAAGRMDKKMNISFLNPDIVDEKLRNRYEILITDGIHEYNQMKLTSNKNSMSEQQATLPQLFRTNHPFVAGVKTIEMKNNIIIKQIIRESNFFVIGLSYIPDSLDTSTSKSKMMTLKKLYLSSSVVNSIKNLNYIALVRFGGMTNKELAIIPLEKIQ